MQLTTAQLKRLVAAGTPAKALVIISEMFEAVRDPSAIASAPVSAAKTPDTSEEKREKERNRKRLARAKAKADKAGLSADKPDKSPTPPLIESPPVISKGVLKGSKESVYAREELESFERFKAAYPKRSGNQPWNKALPKYVRIVRGGVLDLVLIEAADKYRGHCEAEGIVKTKFVAQAITWLNGEGWKNDYEINNSRGSAFSQASKIIRERLEGRGFDFEQHGADRPGDETPPY